MTKTLISLALMASLAGCQGSSNDTQQSAPKPANPAAKVVENPPPEPKISFANLDDAIAKLGPHFGDMHGTDIDSATAVLALWGADNMRWEEIQALPGAKYGMIMKDPASQRGKRLCAAGEIIEIAVDSSVPQKIYLGGLYDEAGHLYRFIAVGSTGELVARSRGKICGVVTGQQHYQNSMGGVAHAAHIVGMFDLPENKTPTVNRKTRPNS